MRHAPPPFPKLSANGQFAIFQGNREVYLLDTQNGEIRTIAVEHEVYNLAISPQAQYIAIVGKSQLTIVTGSQQKTIAIPQRLFRLTIGDEGTILGVIASEFAPSTLFIWENGLLLPNIPSTGYALGRAVPFAVALDEIRKTFLLWGRQGSQAFVGFGDNYLRLFHFDENKIEQSWTGDEIELNVNGCLHPLTDGNFGVHSREKLWILATQPTTQPLQVHDFGNLETLVASPNGQYLAWRWESNQEGQVQYHIRVAHIVDGSIVGNANFDTIGQFPQIAVDNKGQATLIYSEKPSLISVFKVKQGVLVKQIESNLP